MFYRHPAEPYSLLPLKEFLEEASQVLDQNYGALLLSLSAMVSMLNFAGIHEAIGHFNLPVLYGPPMSGKTLTASCVALITGMSKSQISSRNTQAFLSDCFAVSTFPSVWDDPTKEQEVKQVCIDLGNAAFRGKFKEDAKTPLSGCLVTANFNLAEIEKYYSRVCLIPFEKVSKRTQVGEGPALEKRATAASAALPTLIEFAHSMERDDIHRVVEVLRNDGISDLRILEGVAVPCMLAEKILQSCDLESNALFDFCEKVLTYHTSRGNQTASNGHAGEGTPLEKVFLAAKDKEVSAYMKVTGTKLYVRTKEFDSSAGTNLVAVLKAKKIPLYGKSCRFDGKVRKCAFLTKEDMTRSEWEKLQELTDVDDENAATDPHPPPPTSPVHMPPQQQPDPATPQQQQEPAIPQQQPEPATQQQQPEPATPQQQPEPATPQQQPEPATPQQQPEPATQQQQPEPAIPQQQPEPATPQQQPEPATQQQQPEPAIPQQQPEPATPQQQPEPATQQQPEPATQQQPEPATPQQQPEPATPQQQPEPATQQQQPEPATQQPEPATPQQQPEPTTTPTLQQAPAATPQASTPFLKAIQLTKQTTGRQSRSNKHKIFSVTEKSSAEPQSAEPMNKRKREEVIKFLGRNILHTWMTGKGPKVYKGKVQALVKGKDGGKKTIYKVLYEDGTTEELDLYQDFKDGSLQII